MEKPEVSVGIDLGTTFSAVAHIDSEGRPLTIINSEGELTTPSAVFFDHDAVIVGTEATIAGESDTDRLARNAKRDMGGARYRKKIRDCFLPPEVIQSLILNRLKSDAELKLGEFQKAVITVPAYFNEPRRKATQDAGELAGIDVIDIINEPTAAALAYGVQQGFLNAQGAAKEVERVLVYDLGGGTFDVTLMEIKNSHFNTIGTAGDVYLGGIDWDHRILDFAMKEFETKHQISFEDDNSLKEKLMNQCIRAKASLSARSQTIIRIEHNGERYKIEVTRAEFEDLTRDLLERTKLTTERLLRDAKTDWSAVTKLLLVGGSTRMPMVAKMLEKISGLKVDRTLSPDECVAHGAAIYADILLKYGQDAGTGISIKNVNSHDLGVLGIDSKTQTQRRKIVIPRNHSLPTKASRKFRTAKDGQTQIIVRVIEGGTDTGQGATMIGKCIVQDLPPDIKKGTEIVVSFNYLSSGRIDVVAEIPALNISADTAINRADGMTRADILSWKEKLASDADLLDFQESSENDNSATAPPPLAAPTVATATQLNNQKPPLAKAAIVPAIRLTNLETAPEKPTIPAIKVTKQKTNRKLDIPSDEEMFVFEEKSPTSAPGESALDFLNDTSNSSAEGSELDDFLSDLDVD
ncbi:MAG: Hsp70 family protein [Mariniblastus sp.]|nr:Hsp70 family protein [Mariniblastus sp.]MDG2183708.1 Hsp70 family protein [Mariniblastus sp.]